ncbi:MAG: Maf family protein [Armatimonadetes bacterium]|nr:Maf family protein [Armatimonadota bacterium]
MEKRRHQRVILASASPRRHELLRLIFPSFEVIPSNFDENLVPKELEPAKHVVYSAEMKAREVASSNPDSLVIGADTIVVINGEIMGKPLDEQDAARMLRSLSGRTHQVYTGIAAAANNTIHSDLECTDVTFREVPDELISRYIATGEPMDKAGAYAIQGKGSVLITGIKGCYFNVVGLPVFKLSQLLEKFGIEPMSLA